MVANWFDKFSFAIDENKRKVQLGFYGIACVGLAYAMKSVRPFKKFLSAREIPQTFIDRHITLNGNVIAINHESAILRVSHNPVFDFRFRRKTSSGLDVHISGVNVTDDGFVWLKHTLVDKCIHFTLLRKQGDFVSCIVLLNRANIAEELLKLGFATVDVIDFELEKDKLYTKYYRRLLTLEEKAEKKKLGIWADYSQDSRSSFLQDKLVDLFYKLYYKIKK